MKLKLLLFSMLSLWCSTIIAQDIYMNSDDGTEITTCDATFIDHDPVDGFFTLNGSQVVTICSDDPDMDIKAEFTNFALIGGYSLKIYDGDSTAAPLVGTYANGNSPGIVFPSGANGTGCLTFEFVGNGAGYPGTAFGWEAEITCKEPCQEITPEIISVTPSIETTPGTYEVSVNVPIEFEGGAAFEVSGENATYEWDFGDGTTTQFNEGEIVTHAYENEDTYEVTLTVADEVGCSYELIFEVEVVFYAIEVSTTQYTVQELVEDVLINSDCAQISNITSSTGTDFGQANGIGYFNYNNSSFPIEDGILLYTGDANDAVGPETGSQGSGGWPGDPDVLAVAQTIPTPLGPPASTHDASIIEFDFVSFADQMSFNFLFASDEYGQDYQCNYSDAFIFLLTDSNGNETNIALVPGTNTPIAVTTVRDNAYNTGCSDENEEYFGNFYGTNGLPPMSSPTDLEGNTVVMTAQSSVIPGEQYHIKLAIADARDGGVNAGIFLEAGSFDIGELDLGADITAENGTADCFGQSYTLEINLTPIEGVDIQWFVLNEETNVYEIIPGETAQTLEVTEEGTYKATFTYLDDCVFENEIFVEFLPTPDVEASMPEEINACGNANEDNFVDLTQNDENILGGQEAEDFMITYYETETAAESEFGEGAIETPENYLYTGAFDDCVTLYGRIEGFVDEERTGCFDVVSFEVCVGEIHVGTDLADLEECDDDNTGTAVFDLTENNETALGTLNPDEYTVTYYTTQALADAGDAGTEIDTPEGYENTIDNPQTIYVRVQNNDDDLCYAADNSFTIESFPAGIINPSDNIDHCLEDVDSDHYDLTQNEAQIYGTQDPADFVLSYYETQALADAGEAGTEIATPEDYIFDTPGTMSIFVRIESNNANLTDCFATGSFDINLYETTIGELEDLEECDDDSNGSASFDLTQNQAAALNGQAPADYTVTYYTDAQAAEDGVAGTEIANPTAHQNTAANPQDIFVRVEDNLHGCYATGSFVIQSFESGVAHEPDDLFTCDNGTGASNFNLTTNTPLVLGTQDPADFTIAYYETEAAANAGANGTEIDTPDDYPAPNANQTIFVRIENNERPECFNITNFTLSTTTVVIGEVTNKQECDGGDTGNAIFDLTDSNVEALNGQAPADYTVTYYTSQAGADNGPGDADQVADAQNYPNEVNPQEIFVRVEADNSPGCYLTTSFMIEATQSDPIFDPTPLIACDTDNDGFYNAFMLHDKDDEITGGNAGLTVTYHPTLITSENGTDELQSPYANINDYEQIIFVRVEDAANGCVLQTTLRLEVYDSPMIVTPAGPLAMCDDDADGQVFFDLTQAEEEILNGLDPNSYSVTYYENEQAANNGVGDPGQITGPGGYQNLESPQTIWVRVEDPSTPTGCYNVVPLELVVHPLPEPIQPTSLESCDDLASGSDTDETNSFDLSVKENEITGGDTSLTVSWFASAADQAAGIAIADPAAYQNIENYQTIFAQVTDEFGCSATVTLTLTVNPLPSPTPTEELEAYSICDDDNDGIAEFDLGTQDDLIANDEADVTITYYTTPTDAENGLPQNQIGPLYQNTTAGEQVIYARSTNDLTGCYRWVELTLEVTPLPSIPAELEDLSHCDGDGDGTTTFDLTQNQDAIYGDQDPADFSLAYYETEQNAIEGVVDPIGDPTAYSNQGISLLTIWVRLENLETGCFRVSSFDLITGPTPDFADPTPLEVCDDIAGTPTDEIGIFDLTSKDLEIIQDDTSLAVHYYESEADREAGNAIANPEAYENIDNPQTLFVGVSSGEACEAMTTLTLIVNPNPSLADELEALEECDVDNDGFAEFDLAAAIPVILDGEPEVSLSFHRTLVEAEGGDDPINTAGPFQNTVEGGQTIYVRATNTGPNGDDGTGCYTVRPLELIVTPAPEVAGELEDLYLCDDEIANGFTSFDLTQNRDNILGDQDPTDLVIGYYTSQEAAEAGGTGQGWIAVPTNYTNTSNGQTIYVRITDTATGCFDTFAFDQDNSFTLNVEALPVVEPPTALRLCDDDYQTDPESTREFDLTIKESEIAGTAPANPPASYVFTYYANLDDLNNGAAIEDPTHYTNVVNNQTIYILVEDTSTLGGCTDSTTMTIEVLPLPSPSETSLEALRLEQCDDDNDGVAAGPFDLTQSGDLIGDGENVDISYYKEREAAEIGDEDSPEFIADQEAYLNEIDYNTVNAEGIAVQVIYARVESGNTENSCYVLVPFELVVHPTPEINLEQDAVFGYTLCSTDAGAGQAAINLDDIAGNLYDFNEGDGDPAILIPLLDPDFNQSQDLADYTFTYYMEATLDNALSPGQTVNDGDTIYVVVTNNETGCQNPIPAEVRITIEPRPEIVETDIPLGVFCSDEPGGSTYTLDLTLYDSDIDPNDGNPAPNATYVVYYANLADYNAGIPIEDPANYTTIDNPQTLIAEVVNATTLCESPTYAELHLEVAPRPEVDLSAYDGMVVCSDSYKATPVVGGNYDPLLIDTGLPNNGTYTFSWSLDGTQLTDENGATLEVTEGGTYEVTVTHTVTECETISATVIEEHNPPEFDVTSLTSSFDGEHALLVSNITGTGDYEFKLDNGPWMDANGDGTLTFTGIAAGDHMVYGRDKGGCGTTVHTISFMDFPKFFTPNADGYNDTWNIIGAGEGASIYIFDRYGKLLKQLAPNGQGWDGTFNGNLVPSGDYWFRVEYTETTLDAEGMPQQHKRTFKNHFTLKR